MPELNLLDHSFSKENSLHYHLSVQADKSGLVLCIRDIRNGELIGFRKYKFEHIYLTSDLVRQLIAVFDRDDIMRLPYQSVHFMHMTQQVTLVPAAYFSSAHLSDYVDFSLGGESEGEFFSNFIRSLQIYSVFAIPRSLVSLITLHFKKVEFSSQTTPFMWQVAHTEETTNTPVLYVNLNADFFDLAAMDKDKLMLYNTFQYVNETDLLYYVLYVCKQFSLNSREIPLHLFGEYSSRLVYYETLKTYLPRTAYPQIRDDFFFAPGLSSIVHHKYLNLLNLHACELSVEPTKAE